MVRDHSAANKQLEELIGPTGLTLPKELDPEHKAEIEQLAKLRGREFDLAYLRGQGMEAAKIETLAQNAVGSQFYPSVGFREVARQIHYLMRL